VHHASFIGSIPALYDRGLGPIFFTDFADDIARRVAASAPMSVARSLMRLPFYLEFARCLPDT